MRYNPTDFASIGDAKAPHCMLLTDLQMSFYIALCFLGSGGKAPRIVLKTFMLIFEFSGGFLIFFFGGV